MNPLSLITGNKQRRDVPEIHTTVESMMEFMRQYGDPGISLINNKWWARLKIKQGPVEMTIEGSLVKEWTINEAVHDCYKKVRSTLKV